MSVCLLVCPFNEISSLEFLFECVYVECGHQQSVSLFEFLFEFMYAQQSVSLFEFCLNVCKRTSKM